MLMPLVFMLIVFVFYLAFYLYARCIAEEDAYILAFRGSLHCGEDSGRVERYVQDESSQIIGNKYVGIGLLQHKIEADRSLVSMEMTGVMAVTGWKFSVQRKADRICPIKIIRKVRLAKKIGQEMETEIKNNKREY